MFKKSLFVISISALVASVSAQDSVTTVWPPSGNVETFEYADNAALDAVYGTVTVTGTNGISTEQNHSDSGTKSLKLSAGDIVTGGFDPVMESAGTTATATFYFYDADAAFTGTNRQGLSFGAYSGGTWAAGTLENYIGLGMYSPTTTANYSARVVYGGDGWVTTTIPRTTGWRHMAISVQNGTAEMAVDGELGNTQTYTAPTSGWNSFRFGPFAGTANPDAYYDDFSIVKTVASNVEAWHLY